MEIRGAVPTAGLTDGVVTVEGGVVAGVAAMRYLDFAKYNVIGAIAWILSMTLGGYMLGNVIPGIDKRIDVVVIVVIAISLLPASIAWLRSRAGQKST